MYITDLALVYLVTSIIHRDRLADAERERAGAQALAARPRTRRSRIAEARVTIATALLHAGSWLMPEVAPDCCAYPG